MPRTVYRTPKGHRRQRRIASANFSRLAAAMLRRSRIRALAAGAARCRNITRVNTVRGRRSIPDGVMRNIYSYLQR